MVCLTGANGSIGRRLLARLTERFDVRALFRTETPEAKASRNSGCHVVIGDLANEAALRELVNDSVIVFHAAASVTHGLEHATEVNVEGTRRLARAAVAAGCRRFVCFSSIAVYLGSEPRDEYNEESPIIDSAKLDAYSRTKWLGEIALRETCEGTNLTWTILRPTCVYGPGVDSWTLMPLNAIRKGMPIQFGPKGGHIDVIYVDDVADAAIVAGIHAEAAGRVYNLGGEVVPTAEFLRYYARLVGRRPRRMRSFGLNAVVGIAGAVGKVIPLPADKDPNLLKLMAFCTNAPPGVDRFPSQRIREELGCKPQVRLGDGMFRTQRWLERAGIVTDAMETLSQAVGNHRFTPARLYRPATEDQLREVVAESAGQGSRIRAIGSLHSLTRVNAAQDVCISLDAYRDPIGVQGNLVTVSAGMRLSEVCDYLAEHQLALPILGSVKEQTISGAIATGTHGGSIHHASIADSVVGVRVIDGQGNLLELDRSDDRFFGVVQSMGLCGVVSTLTLECVPAFALRSRCWVISFDEMLADFQRLQHEHDYIEFLWHPVIDRVEVFACDRIEPASRPDRELHSVQLGTRNPIGRRLSLWGYNQLHRNRRPRFHRRVVSGRIGKWYTEREGRSDYVLAYAPFDRASCLPMDNHEAAIPYDEILNCIPRLRQRLEEEHHYPVLGVRFRCQRASRHWLNAAFDRDVCWIETFNTLGATNFSRLLHDTFAPFGYRPHWGKTLWMDKAYFAEQYPNWDAFLRLRREFDPANLLLNDYLAEAFAD